MLDSFISVSTNHLGIYIDFIFSFVVIPAEMECGCTAKFPKVCCKCEMDAK